MPIELLCENCRYYTPHVLLVDVVDDMERKGGVEMALAQLLKMPVARFMAKFTGQHTKLYQCQVCGDGQWRA